MMPSWSPPVADQAQFLVSNFLIQLMHNTANGRSTSFNILPRLLAAKNKSADAERHPHSTTRPTRGADTMLTPSHLLGVRRMHPTYFVFRMYFSRGTGFCQEKNLFLSIKILSLPDGKLFRRRLRLNLINGDLFPSGKIFNKYKPFSFLRRLIGRKEKSEGEKA